MVGLDRELPYRPSFLLALLPHQRVQVGGNSPDQHLLPALGAEDKVVQDEVNSVFVVLIGGVQCVDNIPMNDK
jgi:hypothetical protein